MKICLINNRSEELRPEEYGYISSWAHATKKNPIVGLRIEAGISGVPDILMEMTPEQTAKVIAHLSARLQEVLPE